MPSTSGAAARRATTSAAASSCLSNFCFALASLAAFALASLGCDVTIMERHLIVSTLLQDGIDRAKQTAVFQDLPLKLITGNAIELLTSFEPNYFDIIYLDPMYPHRTKSSQVKKEMRILRELVGNDDDSLSLFNLARQCARQRTVVKRPSFAPPIGESTPHFSYKGRSARFDIYLPQQ